MCEICEFNWNTGEVAPATSNQVDLLALGQALLDRQAAAAQAAEEEERYQEEQRRFYGR